MKSVWLRLSHDIGALVQYPQMPLIKAGKGTRNGVQSLMLATAVGRDLVQVDPRSEIRVGGCMKLLLPRIIGEKAKDQLSFHGRGDDGQSATAGLGKGGGAIRPLAKREAI